MFRQLTRRGIRVPDGFAVTAEGYRHFVQSAALAEAIRPLLEGLDTRDLAGLADRGRKIREAFLAAPLPPDLWEEIERAYRELSGGREGGTDVAVRSSATAEDLPGASFAGAQESFLNVRGGRAVLDACRQCFASLFTDRA